VPYPSALAAAANGGFSMVELAVSLAVLMILTAIAIPALMRSVSNISTE